MKPKPNKSGLYTMDEVETEVESKWKRVGLATSNEILTDDDIEDHDEGEKDDDESEKDVSEKDDES